MSGEGGSKATPGEETSEKTYEFEFYKTYIVKAETREKAIEKASRRFRQDMEEGYEEPVKEFGMDVEVIGVPVNEG